MKSIFSPTLLSVALMASASQAALTITGDDFESPAPVPETLVEGAPVGWSTITGGGAFIGRFNADDDTGTAWYHGVSGTDFDDTSSAGGVVNSMNGPSKVTIFQGGAGDGMFIDIGTIDALTEYSADIAISGQRSTGETPHGYSIDLLSGSTVLASTSGASGDTALLLFDDVSVTWDSSVLPGGVSVGDTLTFRITSDGTGDYLDFDDVVFSATPVPEPSALLLLGLSSLGLAFRRRRE